MVTTGTAARAQAREPDRTTCLDAYERGQVLLRAGTLRAAREQLVVCARAPCPAVLQPECVQWLDDATRRMPSVVVVLRTDRGEDVPEASLSVDGKLVASRLDGRSVEIDPGEHVLRVETTARPRPWAKSVNVLASEGDKGRIVAVTMPTEASEPEAGPPAQRGAFPLPGWIALGVAGAGALTFATFALLGEQQYGELERCRPSCDPSDVKRADTFYAIGDIGLGVALVSAGVAAVYYLTRGRADVARVPTIGVAF